jgi:membrane glycosyltransferase
LFGRLLQFGAALYSPMLAAGQSFWQTDAANYWGHNAIVRAAAFDAYCRLPVLPGRPPLGGAILSHDFVEAALLRRAGWRVYLLPHLDGSHEEVPGNVPDYATRDRRWAQGSVQHLRLLTLRGLHPLSRAHFLLGATGYISSLLWLLMLLASTAYVVVPVMVPGWVAAGRFELLGDGTMSWNAATGFGQLVPLLAVTVALLFVPKALGLALGLARRRQAFGGAGRLLASGCLELLFAVTVAPVMMVYHSRFVLSVLAGRDVRWEAQARAGRAVSWREAWQRTVGITAAGALWSGLTLAYSPVFVLWLMPIFVGLLLAAPLVRWTSSRSLGRRTRSWGLFLTPTEVEPPAELQVSSERSAPRGRRSRPDGRRARGWLDQLET